MGDSVGHWQGDTLIIDTVGIKTDDFTRLTALARRKTEGIVGGGARFSGVNPDTSLKGLQLEIDDGGPARIHLTSDCARHLPATDDPSGRSRSAPTTRWNITRVNGSGCPERNMPIFKEEVALRRRTCPRLAAAWPRCPDHLCCSLP
jgi:hypothetical protein